MKKLFTRSFWFLFYWLPALAHAQTQPDLVVLAPFTVPGYVQAGGAYQMSAVIKNQGTNGAQFNCIGYYLSTNNLWDANDAYLGTSCQGLLFPGQSGTCSINGIIPPLTAPGSYYLVLVADPLNAEIELDETNNVVSFPVTVAAGNSSALPDLELWRPSLSFSVLPAGGNTGSFTFIFNRGTVSSAGYDIGFYLSADTVFSATSDVFMGIVSGSGLTPSGGTVHSIPVLTVPVTTAPGNYYLLLMADPRNVIAEANENNNSRALPLRVTGAISAVAAPTATQVAVYPNPVARGARLAVQTSGAGSKTLEGCFYDALGRVATRQLVALNGQLAYFDTNTLPAGMYLLRVTGDNLSATQRVVIE